jgi:DNA-binding beta-propeller fold protein YncE
MRRTATPLVVLALATLGALVAQRVTLPTLWRLSPPVGNATTLGTMPQGIALSPDGTKLAVVESGFNPPALRILATSDLHVIQTVTLKDAFGIPVWIGSFLYVAGGASDAVWSVNANDGSVSTFTQSAGWPDAVALLGSKFVVANDDTATATVRSLFGRPTTVRVGKHPGAILISPADSSVYIANRGESTLTHIIDLQKTQIIAVDLHPTALAFTNHGALLYVACSDADAIDVVSVKTNTVVGRINVGSALGRGASPNALAVAPDGTLYVSLGAENAVAEIRDGKVVSRAPAGWYPTGVAVDNDNVYVIDGKGEGSRANPQFSPGVRHGGGYVAAELAGSVRAIPRASFDADSTAEVLANIPTPIATPAQTIVRANGPIQHVIYIIKENRTYDQVLGDLPGADGDPKLAWFGANVTPNDHAIATRFGVFDNTYADAQVSANGHNWSTAAFANDYLERFWPPEYANRRKTYDFEDGAAASTPGTGYLWDNADRHGVSLRDYGEFVTYSVLGAHLVTTSMPGLQGKIDVHYPGFDLKYSDEDRVNEWQREFAGYVAHDNLPQLEIVRLPNDHTSATAPDMLIPQAYVAQNDHALGRIVDAVSHSPYWKNTVILAIEDDAQNGPDHVDDQRTTFYVASAYAQSGVHHAHYTTSSVVHTIELLLGLPPMTIFDTVAPPLYDAFALQPNFTPYAVLDERIDVNAKNLKTAYGSAKSARMDFSREDDVDPAIVNDILAHVAGRTHP